jgi:hypothetical protein
VIIMDNRMSPRKDGRDRWVGTRYGRQIFNNMPPARDLRTEREMVKYLRALAADDPE